MGIVTKYKSISKENVYSFSTKPNKLQHSLLDLLNPGFRLTEVSATCSIQVQVAPVDQVQGSVALIQPNLSATAGVYQVNVSLPSCLC